MPSKARYLQRPRRLLEQQLEAALASGDTMAAKDATAALGAVIKAQSRQRRSPASSERPAPAASSKKSPTQILVEQRNGSYLQVFPPLDAEPVQGDGGELGWPVKHDAPDSHAPYFGLALPAESPSCK